MLDGRASRPAQLHLGFELAALAPRANCLVEILRRHAHEELVAVLEVDGGLEAARFEVGPQHLLGHRQAVGAEAAHAVGQLEGAGEQVVVDHARDQADALGLFGIDLASGQDDLERARGSDQAGQQVADPALGAGQAVVDAGAAERGLARGQTDVGAERQAHSAATGRAVDGGDQGLGTRCHFAT